MGGYLASALAVCLLLPISSHRPFTISISAHWRDTQAHFLRRFQPGQISIMPPQAIGIFGFGNATRSTSGEAFRFKPDGILFNSPSAYRAIYQTKANVKKGKFYESFSRNSQYINTVTTVDKIVHARKRRVLNSAFSEKAIRSAETFVVKHVDRWTELIIDGNDGKEWTAPQNMSNLAEYLVFDIMGDLSFGTSFDLKEAGENRFRHIPHTIAVYMQLMYRISQSPILRAWVWLKPRGLDGLLESASPKNVKDYYAFVDQSVIKRRGEEESLEMSGADKSQGRKDLLHYLFKTTDDAGNPAYSVDELNAEANMLIIGGSDTTSTILSGFWFYLTRHPRVYAKLVEEIRTTFKSADDIKTGPALISCKYLQACVEETMRLSPAGVSELAREVLPGGLDIAGHHIPEGIHVGVATWVIMHNEEFYGDAWVYRPERWIPDSVTGVTAEDVARAQSCFNPFTIGQYNCVGQKLAMVELLITTAKTLHRMDVRLAHGDTLGAGALELGWGMRSKDHVALKDAYISLKDGPMLQFRRRTT
ncbi:hypothetical protein V500_01542 [Pseudogymnoascus sp. VKM F-4518 (FW-2643)]|nr:hypothetical protein V500_01542 [Pseudogymnoascus sp. VKM F-4518 (FW-2643)]